MFEFTPHKTIGDLETNPGGADWYYRQWLGMDAIGRSALDWGGVDDPPDDIDRWADDGGREPPERGITSITITNSGSGYTGPPKYPWDDL